ncbi:MAG: prepilin-type N-terminal cleavage/methylation domain-containing protein [Deltaproteobacteria bacterium]|nr:prepilin-type N-terminal cleavage/methylation domain-containing protein [Deltaproteobacteria bacterium]
MHISIKESDPGFSLIEVMVAVSIIAIALTAALGLQSKGFSLAGEAKFSTTASMLAQKKSAEIESGNIDQLIDFSGDFGDDFPGYSWEISIENSYPSQDGISDYLKQINMKISWGGDEKYIYQLRFYQFVTDK